MKSNEIIENYNEIWKRASNSVKQWFDTKSVYNEKYQKTEIKSYNGKINTNFNNNKIRKEGCQCICLSVILIDSVYRRDINYCTEAFLE